MLDFSSIHPFAIDYRESFNFEGFFLKKMLLGRALFWRVLESSAWNDVMEAQGSIEIA